MRRVVLLLWLALAAASADSLTVPANELSVTAGNASSLNDGAAALVSG